MSVYTTEKGSRVTLNRRLKGGGEGAIHTIANDPYQVAKIYAPDKLSPDQEEKLKVMVKYPPKDTSSMTWPTALLYQGTHFAGYTMKYITSGTEIFTLFNPKKRKEKFPWASWKHMHHAARNLAIAMNALHTAHYIMGDINEKNFLITNDMMIIMIDTDSFQVRSPGGRIFRCGVGVAKYNAPEILQTGSFDAVDREPYHDSFGLGVLIFQLLMEGHEPFTGAPRDTGKSYRLDHCQRRGIFPYTINQEFAPPPAAPNFDTLHPDVRQLFMRCFVDGYRRPRQRPSAKEWVEVLGKAESNLKQCRSGHWYQRHLGSQCPWCSKAILSQQSPVVITPFPTNPPPITPSFYTGGLLTPLPKKRFRPNFEPLIQAVSAGGQLVFSLIAIGLILVALGTWGPGIISQVGGAVLSVINDIGDVLGGLSTTPPGTVPLQIGATARVNASAGLNMRSGPGVGYERLTVLPDNTRVTIIDGPRSGGGYQWWKVQTSGGAAGWVVEATGGQRTLVYISGGSVATAGAAPPKCDGKTARFKTSEIVVVSQAGDNLLILQSPGGDPKKALELAVTGDRLEILSDPVCTTLRGYSEKSWYWFVHSQTDGLNGWVADGPSSERWLCPRSSPKQCK